MRYINSWVPVMHASLYAMLMISSFRTTVIRQGPNTADQAYWQQEVHLAIIDLNVQQLPSGHPFKSYNKSRQIKPVYPR